MAKKEKLEAQAGVTPRGVVIWTDSLYKKDMKFAKGDESKAKFKGYITYDKDAEASEDWVQERIARHKAAKGASDKCPVKDGDEKQKKATQEDVNQGLADEVGEEINDDRLDGKWYVQFTTKHQPALFDAYKKQLAPGNFPVKSGDVCRFQYQENVVEDGSMRGVFLYLNGVQLLEKRNTGRTSGDLFDVVDDGYQAPDEDQGAMADAADSGDDY